jgi:hypothetical protein
MLLDAHPGTVVLLQMHSGDSASTSWGDARATYYSLSGTPTAWFDGTTQIVGASSISSAYSQYTSAYNTRRNVTTYTTISGAAYAVSPNQFNVRAQVGIEALGATQTMRVYIAQVIDNWPTSPNYHRYGFRQAASFQEVTLNPGETTTVIRTLTLDSTSLARINDVKFVVWAQSTTVKTVYQAAVFGPPFPYDCNNNTIDDSVDIANGTSLDCNANQVPDECDIANQLVEDVNHNGVPDECENVPGDVSCNGTTGFEDINPFVMALTCPTCFQTTYPLCNIRRADVNGDGYIDFADINPFVAVLTGH